MHDRMSEIFWHPVTAASRAPRFPTTWPRNDGLWGREWHLSGLPLRMNWMHRTQFDHTFEPSVTHNLTWDQAFYFFFFCFFAFLAREGKKTDYRDKGRGHDRRLLIIWSRVFWPMICHVKLTGSVALEQKRFELWSLSPHSVTFGYY